VTKRGLLIASAFVASASLAWAADTPPFVQRGLYKDGRWSVAGLAFANGYRNCVLANTQHMSGGETAFVLNEFGSDDSAIMFRDTSVTWDASGGSITFQVDDNPSFTAEANTDTRRNLLVVPLRGTSSTIMGMFMNQLASGHQLKVTANARTPRTFVLNDAQLALDAFGRCVAALHNY
jgi:hypothetical protein